MQTTFSDDKPITALVSDDYRRDHERLIADPALQRMAAEVLDGIRTKGLDPVEVGFIRPNTEGGVPTFQFMRACGDRYRALGGKHGETIGAVATALWAIVLAELLAEPGRLQ